MAIGDIKGKISESDKSRHRKKKVAPEYEDGFEPSEDDDDLMDDVWSNLNDDISEESKKSESSTTWTSNEFTPSTQNQQPVQPQQPMQKDLYYTVLDGAGLWGVEMFKAMAASFKGARSKGLQDAGDYFRNVVIVALGFIGAAGALWLLNAVWLKSYGWYKLAISLLGAGVCLAPIGIIGLTITAIIITKKTDATDKKEQNLEHLSCNNEDEEDDEDSSGYLFDDEDDDDDFGYGGSDSDDDDDDIMSYLNDEENSGEIKEVDFDSTVESIPMNVPLISRSFLVDTFIQLLECNTPGYSKYEEMDPDSGLFENIEILCTKALASAAKKEVEDIETELIKAYDTYFCYEVYMKRVRSLSNKDAIAEEVTAFFRDSSDDANVFSTVDLEGDAYKISIYKGSSAVVTMGDVLQSKEAVDYFKSNKNKLPVIVGILPNGKPVIRDAKLFDTMLIAGKPRSGKTWYLLNMMLCMMLFNSPEDVQFVIIDPKKSPLLTHVSWLPHVCGYHKHDDIIEILQDIVEIEGARREKLLSDNDCEDIWELKELHGVDLPVLWVVIDEIMTIKNSFPKTSWDKVIELMTIITTQFPAKGIRLAIIPHRSKGVIERTLRSVINFCVAIRATNDVVLETLDIKKFSYDLMNVGDVALLCPGDKPKYVRGTAVMSDDIKNKKLIRAAAKSFYKMNAPIPDMSNIGKGYNRNEKLIHQKLYGSNQSHNLSEEELNDVEF